MDGIFHTARSIAASTGRAALDLLLPPSCLTCDAPVRAPGQFCATCFGKARFITEPFCNRCGLPFTHQGAAGSTRVCEHCHVSPPEYDRARAALLYGDHAKRLILPLKHGDRVELARQLAPMLARAGAGLLREADLLVPVPLHRGRLFSRRYNQAALLAQALARRAGVACLVDGLERHRATKALGELGARARAAQLEGAIAVPPSRAEAIAGKRVVLIDDVLTTGATAGQCTRALRYAGAAAVDVLVIARVADPRDED